MDEFLKDLRCFLGWAIPAVIKLVLILAVLIIALALLPFWIFFRMPALRKTDVLLVTEFSRLARSVREVLNVVETLGERGVTAYVTKLRVRLNGKNDIATTAIISSMALAAQIERDLISSRTREALAGRKAQGKRLGMTAPNHNVVAIQSKAVEALKAKAQTRAIDLETLLTSMCGRSLTQRQMVEELNRLGISSPRGGEWSQATVCRMLKRIA